MRAEPFHSEGLLSNECRAWCSLCIQTFSYAPVTPEGRERLVFDLRWVFLPFLPMLVLSWRSRATMSISLIDSIALSQTTTTPLRYSNDESSSTREDLRWNSKSTLACDRKEKKKINLDTLRRRDIEAIEFCGIRQRGPLWFTNLFGNDIAVLVFVHVFLLFWGYADQLLCTKLVSFHSRHWSSPFRGTSKYVLVARIVSSFSIAKLLRPSLLFSSQSSSTSCRMTA